MNPTILLLASDLPIAKTWFLLPLVVIISLVYMPSRFESPYRSSEAGRQGGACKSWVSWRWCWWCSWRSAWGL